MWARCDVVAFFRVLHRVCEPNNIRNANKKALKINWKSFVELCSVCVGAAHFTVSIISCSAASVVLVLCIHGNCIECSFVYKELIKQSVKR